MTASKLDTFIGRLYQSTQNIDIGHFRNWALNELRELISFDACIWSTGHLNTHTFHTHTLINLPESYPEDLRSNFEINPISEYLFSHPSEPVDMSDVIGDEAFYQSEIYHKLFKTYQIERILSSIHVDNRSGIHTLLTLYRKDRNQVFQRAERTLHQSALHHLINAATMAGFASLNNRPTGISYSAICDRHGMYHAVEESFMDLIEETFPDQGSQRLPFDLSN